KPYLLKTNDYGKTWQSITEGIPETEFTRTIREDPVRRGLLYAGTETGIYVSFDDGFGGRTAWQRLQANLPVTPIHDLIVKGSDMVVAPHGRSFWILDDLSALRELTPDTIGAAAHLVKPRTTTRFKFTTRAGRPTPLGVKNFRRAGPLVCTYVQSQKPT